MNLSEAIRHTEGNTDTANMIERVSMAVACMIISGELKGGDFTPSINDLHFETEVSRRVIAEGLGEAVGHGLLQQSRRGSRFEVVKGAEKDARDLLARHTDHLIAILKTWFRVSGQTVEDLVAVIGAEDEG